MVVPLDKPLVANRRYELLAASPKKVRRIVEEGDEISGLKYVSFIKELPVGKEKDEIARLPPPSKVSSAPPTTSAKSKAQNPLRDVIKLKKKNEEIHEKKLKEIEECMFQSNQEERELRRLEGDIIQRGKRLKKTMRDYEIDVYKNQRKEGDKILKATNGENSVKQQTAIDEMKLTKDRIHRNTINMHKEKESDLKRSNTITGLEYQYGNVADAILLKRNQINQMVKDFEEKVVHHEEEEFRLKQEFAKLTLEINMEAQKKRAESSTNESFNKKIDDKNRSDRIKREEVMKEKIIYQNEKARRGELGSRRLSQEKGSNIEAIEVKKREDGRRLRDVKVRIMDNAFARKQAQIKGDLIQREMLGVKSSEKVMTVAANRQMIQDIINEDRKQKNDLSLDQWRQRNLRVNHENKMISVDDSISHFQKTVSRQESTEHDLFNQVKKVEYERKKQEQTVDLMKQELMKLQKQNKLLLLETEKQCKLKENDILDRLRKEEAQLGRALSEREERIQTLNRCRSMLTEDKHMLGEEKKVRDRLYRIEQKSALLRTVQEV